LGEPTSCNPSRGASQSGVRCHRREQDVTKRKRPPTRGSNHLKKSGGLFCEGVDTIVKYAFIKTECPSHSVTLLCELAKVSSSGYYAYLEADARTELLPSEEKRNKIDNLVEKCYTENYGIAGAVKIHQELQKKGEPVTLYGVRRSCRRNNFYSCTKKKFRVKTTDSNHENPVAENHLDRCFESKVPNSKWVTDITYVATLQGFL
jgi:hypothetical protein